MAASLRTTLSRRSLFSSAARCNRFTPVPTSLPGFRCIATATEVTLNPLPGIDISKLVIEKTQKPKEMPPYESLKFGRNFTDHMLTIPWTLEEGWGTPKIEPYGPLALDPSSTVFHYAQCLFEGMKAYRDVNGKVTLFRPDMNMLRMNRSAQRIALPTFDGDALTDLIKKLVAFEKNWIPQLPGYSLYIRPTMIGTQKSVGITPPDSALLFVILSPVGPYYPDGFKPVALYGTTEYTRASPGGTGEFKLGANYAPSVYPQKKAAEVGYVQNLWLYGPEHYLTEVGTMNLFVVFRKPDGTLELVTPPLDGMILPGVTRDSVLQLAQSHAAGTLNIPDLTDKLVVSERGVTMKEVKDAALEGRLVELFGTGTAAVISPVDRIGYQGQDVHIPVESDGMGPVSRPIWKELMGRQMGTIPSDWSVQVTE
ncbi:branched-chain amino acid aminotransferase II [Stereum hirsutum FP-91666 SS1]|uniref:branched-chain amino acid aminotransferase II n=1 Tax=Stereum hirsutum (strain FP-91666) TaxID=721885 RepID=UPI0004449F61|nr:branched-chain amino acid aminotransferase II [Stereum hirsutum FP-91666 SS1]EIM83386.1 branched-chain amino acid aminotransferase II [Stereum hirsutum FP-91666 SS1]